MKPSFVCLMAPELHLSCASHCRDAQHSPCQLLFADRETITSDLNPERVSLCTCMLWNRCRETWPLRWVEGLWPRESVPLPPCHSSPLRPRQGVTYARVVRNVGCVCVFAARQLELGSLMGVLHGIYRTAMARRLVWQQLTLDLSCPLLSTETHRVAETYKYTVELKRHILKTPLYSLHAFEACI